MRFCSIRENSVNLHFCELFLGGGGGAAGFGLTFTGGEPGLELAPSFLPYPTLSLPGGTGGGGFEVFFVIRLLPCFGHEFDPFYICNIN